MKTTVAVVDADLNKSLLIDQGHDPITSALKRMGIEGAVVKMKKDISGWVIAREGKPDVELPPEACSYLDSFDAMESPKPITFEVEL